MSGGDLSRLVQTLNVHRDVLGALDGEPRSLNSIARQLKRTNGPVGRHLGALQIMGIAERADGGWRLASGTARAQRMGEIAARNEPDIAEIERRVAELPSPARRAKLARRCECSRPMVDSEGDCSRCGRST